jgi:endogenous inhibitor of DNA gyrase (YacG/DUF329 family)
MDRKCPSCDKSLKWRLVSSKICWADNTLPLVQRNIIQLCRCPECKVNLVKNEEPSSIRIIGVLVYIIVCTVFFAVFSLNVANNPLVFLFLMASYQVYAVIALKSWPIWQLFKN